MKKWLIIVAVIMSIFAISLAEACVKTVEEDNEKIPENADIGEQITANNVQITNGEYLLFSGYSKLPEHTRLQTQLYVNGQPEEWWPADRYVEVSNRQWNITVPLGKDGAPQALSVGSEYVFKVWQKDNPSVSATLPFDLNPPPSLESN
jgi:hypothetical protein